MLQDLKYEEQEKMVAGDEECCKLLDERLAKFDEFVEKLKEELSVASDRERQRQDRKKI